jgi:hypothetical protein
MIKSVFSDQDELLLAISRLYLDGGTFECDPCFNKGGFYRKLGRPRLVGDIAPRFKWCPVIDVRDLPADWWNLRSAVFDPPFLIGQSSMVKRYGGFENLAEMCTMLETAIVGFSRVLKPGGVLVCKCQDTSVGGQNFFTHVRLMQTAVLNGFMPVDIFVLVNSGALLRVKNANQRMASKAHSYFLVFKKVQRLERIPKI